MSILGRAPAQAVGAITEAHVQRCRSQPAESVSAILLLGVVVAAALTQGGFFAQGQIAVAGLLAASVVIALPVRRAICPDLRLPLLAGGLLAGWTLLRAIPHGSLAAAVREALLLGGVATVLMLCRRLDRRGRRLVLAGLLGTGVLLAVVGWIGVVWRIAPWALPSQGLWRGASTITYANATAAVLVPLALTALALLSKARRSLPLGLILTVLLVGIIATLSRAGALALLVGLGVLVLARGRSVLRALVEPLIGAAVAFAGLLPSLPEAAPPRPGVAVAALFAGVGLTALLLRHARQGWAAAAVAVLVLAVLPVGRSAMGSAPIREAGLRVWDKRANVASLNRSGPAAAALRTVVRQPMTGIGPGRVLLPATNAKGWQGVQRYIHNEYLQVLTEVGAIGLGLLALVLAGLARLIWRSRALERATALWAGVAAGCVGAAVHAGFDFVWHVPAVPLTMAVLVGLVIPPANSSDHVA